MKSINVVITMDSEPLKSAARPEATGPDNWDLGQRACEGYADVAQRHGFPVTYFVHPETALAQRSIYQALAAKGACLGLHVHAWKFAVSRHAGRRYMKHYGHLTENEQRAILAEAGALWQEAFGSWPLYFRPGTFSANDAIFRVLSELGFRGGSCSVPGRVMPEMQAIWAGTEVDAHRGDADFRQIAGELEFANMPLAVDLSRSLSMRNGWGSHPDLRPDVDWEALYGLSYDTIAESILKQVIERAPAVPTISVVSHNHYDYSDPSDPARVRFEKSLAAIVRACERAGIEAKGVTIADVVDQVLSRPAVVKAPVFEGQVIAKVETSTH